MVINTHPYYGVRSHRTGATFIPSQVPRVHPSGWFHHLTSIGVIPTTTVSPLTAIRKTVVVAPGLPSLDKSLVEQILSDQFIDLPPAKGCAPTSSKILEGHNLYVVQPIKRLIHQTLRHGCMFLRIHGSSKYPVRATSLLLNQKNIVYLSQRFRWPSWVVYDNSFRSEAAKTDWSQIDYGVHSRSFHNQTLLRDSWCSNCHSVDHLQTDCPYAKTGDPQKKRSAVPYPTNPTQPFA